MANPDGTPIWFELTTSDQDQAQAFYEALAEWQVSSFAEFGGYRVAKAGDGEGVAGLTTPSPGTGGLPGWMIYFAATDVDALTARVQSLGGSLFFGPMDIPDVGRFAVVGDPQGVAFCLMKGASPEDSTAFRQEGTTAGHAVWIELATPDPDGAIDFYGELFGWAKLDLTSMGGAGDYTVIGTEDFCPGATMSSEKTGAPPRWYWYIGVSDIDAAIATAVEKGGTLRHGPDEIPGGDYSANLNDSQGFQIGIVGPRK